MSDQWAAPKESEGDGRKAITSGEWTYKPLGIWTNVLVAFVLTIAGLEILLTGLDLWLTFVWTDFYATEYSTFVAIVALAMAYGALGTLGLFFLYIPLWCIWHYRAGANLHALDRTLLMYSPAAQVYWWFVPIANLFMPFKTMSELLRGAAESDVDNAAFGAIRSNPAATMGLWWALHLIGGFANQCSFRLSWTGGAEDISSVLGVLGTVGSVGAAYFYVGYVKRIEKGLERQAK